jgi:hypothetical protein
VVTTVVEDNEDEDMMMSSRGDGAEGKKCGSVVAQIRLRQ